MSLLQGITNTGSLAQVSRLQSSIERISQQVSNKETLGPLIKVIMQIASQQNFAEKGVVSDLMKQFNELRKNLVDSLNQETADEAIAAKDFEDRVKQLNTELVEF